MKKYVTTLLVYTMIQSVKAFEAQVPEAYLAY